MTGRYIVADVFDGLAQLEDESVDLVITSPPFLALRSYLPADHPDKEKEIGSEATPAEWIDVMLEVTKELRRVLAPHGSLCVELGDTYAGSTGFTGDDDFAVSKGRQFWITDSGPGAKRDKNGPGWPLAKSKTLIPQLYEIALAYGFNPLTGTESPAGKWRVRNVVTWARPNPPVGALGDKWRPATSDVVVAATSDKRYWDDLATRKPWSENTGGMGLSTGNYYERLHEIDPTTSHDTTRGAIKVDTQGGAPLLDYWEIPPTGYSGAHYAVYPPALIEPLVKAMCPQKVCRECGEPSRRIVENDADYGGRIYTPPDFKTGNLHRGWEGNYERVRRASDGGWTDCGCPCPADDMEFTDGRPCNDDCSHRWRPGIVVDPFAGTGTTLMVATGHGHDAIGIDIDERNAELALERVGPFLLDIEA